MNKEAWISAITAFLISAGGAIGVVLVGDTPTLWQVLAAIVLGLVTAAKDIRSLFKLPPVDKVGLLLLCGVLSFGVGCVPLRPGEDPIVVRTEQALTSAEGTFKFVLRIDHADRGFWRTNAPAFHTFAEELRRPTPYQITNTLPQWRVALLSVNDVKLDYKTARQSSNALATAVATLQGLSQQAGAWLTIVTNRSH